MPPQTKWRSWCVLHLCTWLTQLGVIYKAIGYGCEGPIGPANEEFLWQDDCGTPSLDRFALTYDQTTHGTWINGAQLLYDMVYELDGEGALNFSEANPEARQVIFENV